MTLVDNVAPGDFVVREFSDRYLIWRVREKKAWSVDSRHEGLGEIDDRDSAISRARELAGNAHAVWFCDMYERYKKIRSDTDEPDE